MLKQVGSNQKGITSIYFKQLLNLLKMIKKKKNATTYAIIIIIWFLVYKFKLLSFWIILSVSSKLKIKQCNIVI